MSEQPAVQNHSGNAANTPIRKKNRWLIGCTTVFVVLIVGTSVIVYVLLASAFYGKEFSPDTFETREFFYMRIPWTGTVLSKRTLVDSSSVFHKTLVSDGYVQPPSSPTNRWDLISENYDTPISPDFDAAILDSYLEMSTDGHDRYWQNWNELHPKRATVFWPVIADLARANQYVLMPDLFRMTMTFPDEKATAADPYTNDLRKLTVKLLKAQAARYRQSSNETVAMELEQLAESIGKQPAQPAGESSKQ